MAGKRTAFKNGKEQNTKKIEECIKRRWMRHGGHMYAIGKFGRKRADLST